MTADEIISELNLQSHPEGGWFRETWRADSPDGSRAAGTSIYFLLKADEVSHWHRVDAAEVWHWYAGAALELSIAAADGTAWSGVLGADLSAGQRPQRIVPPHAWQSARSLGEYTLVGCTVSPGFEFSTFELAPAGWVPGSGTRA